MKQPFQVGEQVTCLFVPEGSPPSADTAVRSILAIAQVSDPHEGKVGCTGWLASADGGKPCPHCGATLPPIPMIDSGYFRRVET